MLGLRDGSQHEGRARLTRRSSAPPTPDGISGRIGDRSRVVWAGDEYEYISTDGAAFWAMIDALDPDECLPEGLVVVLDDGSWLQTATDGGEYGWHLFSTPERGSGSLRTLLGAADLSSVDQEAEPLPAASSGPVARMKAEIAGIKARHADDADARFDALVDLRVRRAEAYEAQDIGAAEWDWTSRLLDAEVANADPGPWSRLHPEDGLGIAPEIVDARRRMRRADFVQWLIDGRNRLIAMYQAREVRDDVFESWMTGWDSELRRMGHEPAPLPERPAFRPRVLSRVVDGG